ncbi:MAG TPA: hypothetical protein VMF03_16840 [Steroidobacteraceae bacterium]|nr:hypothetical protein [Steroidobacteraceae bacterium]
MTAKQRTLFAELRELRQLEKKHLPFVRSFADFDLIVEVGYHEERGTPLTYKHLLSLIACGRSTLNRRLSSLIAEGVILRTRSELDGRAIHLGVSKSAMQRFHRYLGGLTSQLAGA